jgi:tight adherence protein C
MSGPAAEGALIGLCAGVGVLVAVRMAPPMRRVRLVDRVAPYLGVVVPPRDESWTPMAVVGRIIAPSLANIAPSMERLVGGSASVGRRLEALGDGGSVEAFRLEQLAAAVAGLIGLGGVGVVLGRPPVLVAALGLAGFLAGFLGRDWWLGRRVKQREAALLAELPLVADLLALAVIAGESTPEALIRVARLTNGALAGDLRRAMAEAQSGATLTSALTRLAERSNLEPLSRFLQGIVVALDRGTPLAGVLRSQADDVRDLTKRRLLEAGGRKEISMMLPVVFLILPVTVLFALYPGLLTLTSLTH